MTDPAAFLQHILPTAGPYCYFTKLGEARKNHFATTIEGMWRRELAQSARGFDVYHACGSVREARNDPPNTPEPDKRFGRTGYNIKAIRSLWLDLDAGAGKPYATPRDAAEAVMRFCQVAHLPTPTFVTSGGGCHAYWVFKTEIPAVEWLALANGLKAACRQHGLMADPARTADDSSVMRTPGTINHKWGTQVRCGPLTGPYELNLFMHLKSQAPAIVNKNVLGELPSHLTSRSNANALISKSKVSEFIGSYADKVADRCAQIRAFRDDVSKLEEPLWYKGVGVIACCVDDEKCIEWSRPDKRYDEADTRGRMERQRRFGPTRCENFEDTNPAPCRACPHHGRITSPIELGYADPTPPAGSSTAAQAVCGEVTRLDAYPDYVRGEGGKPLAVLASVLHALRTVPTLDGMFAYDEMRCTVVLARPLRPNGHWKVRPLADVDVSEVQEWLQQLNLKRVTIETMHQAIAVAARARTFHPIRDWLSGLRWDGIRRLTGWLPRYVGCPDIPYTCAAGRMFLLALVARVFRPGCQADYMLILEGEQGELKSSLCRALVGDEWFSDNLPSLHQWGKDAAQHLRGKWLVEIAEMHAFDRADSALLKSFITRREEIYRPPHARLEVREPRQSLLIGSTNKTVYWRDETGMRRGWPIECVRIQLEAVLRDREQLFAEAMEAFRAGEAWWPTRDFERQHMAPQQARRQQEDEWENLIAGWLAGTHGSTKPAFVVDPARYPRQVTISEVAFGALGMDLKLGTADQNRIRTALTQLGWHRSNTRSEKSRWWVPR